VCPGGSPLRLKIPRTPGTIRAVDRHGPGPVPFLPVRRGQMTGASFRDDLRVIEAEFATAAGDPDRVAGACSRLRAGLTGETPMPELLGSLLSLTPLLRRRSGRAARELFTLLEEAAAFSAEPWPVLSGLLAARDPELRLRALGDAAALAGKGVLRVDLRVVRGLAELAAESDSILREGGALQQIAAILSGFRAVESTADPDPVLALYLTSSETRIRRLAALILDRDGEPAPAAVRERLLGREIHLQLGRYLDYSRATHLDLIEIAPILGQPPACLASLRDAGSLCGERLLQDVIAELGWARVNLGIRVCTRVAVSVGGSFPLQMSPAEAQLLDGYKPAWRLETRHLFVAHGGRPPGETEGDTGEDPVGRFRSYNLAHAQLLGEILSVAPLSLERVERLLGSMDRVVTDFVFLFSRYEEECAALPRVYAGLRERIVAELGGAIPGRPLSADLTRLVQMFEDPKSLAEVRTLHGLKRYLHQKGLRLGFRLVDSGRATNRSIDLVVASADRILAVASPIRYVDFEPDEDSGGAESIPYPVRVVADGFGRQLLQGGGKLPDVKVFCYGNEVHYFVAFGNHPAFLRIDFSPPLSGGMIDLEYYGVSKYELTEHPEPELPAIRHFFRRLDFDAKVANTRIHARYDKERAVDLAELYDRVEGLFRLVPHLMELDWTIGSLRLSEEARRDVAMAWCDFLLRWGVLPVDSFLTRDRQGILWRTETEPGGGEREIVWPGTGPYSDRFVVPEPEGFSAHLEAALAGRGLTSLAPLTPRGRIPFGQLPLERTILRPLREAIDRGEIVEGPDGLAPAPSTRYEPLHEARCFADLLSATGTEGLRFEKAARLASIVAPLERSLRFRTTGSVNGYEVQRARLTLRGGSLALFVLRDGGGIARLAIASSGELPCRVRGGAAEELQLDATVLTALLRKNGYLTPGIGPERVEGLPDVAARALRSLFTTPNPQRRAAPLPGERVLLGVSASPGRSAGVARFGTAGRNPIDLEGAILVARTVSPEENAYLYRCSGIVTTGGGILSHAGLLAVQFRKPSLLVPGRWDSSGGGTPSLLYPVFDYEEAREQVGGVAVKMRRNIREREERLCEGDLVVLDADEGTLRVLGHDRDTLALHEELRQMREIGFRLAGVTADRDLLDLRGRRLRARHHLERLLARLRDPLVARSVVWELLVGDLVSAPATTRTEKADLLRILITNPAVDRVVGECAIEGLNDLEGRVASRMEEALRLIPDAEEAYEIFCRRLEILRLRGTLQGVRELLGDCGLDGGGEAPIDTTALERLARDRISDLVERLVSVLAGVRGPIRPRATVRHLLRQIERLEGVHPDAGAGSRRLQGVRARLAAEDDAAVRKASSRRVLRPEDGGLELRNLIGSKAANLAEVERLLGERIVPAWFVVTDAALRDLLVRRLGEDGPVLSEAIESILAQGATGDAQKSFLIRKLWEGVSLPGDLETEMLAAYRTLGEPETEEDKGGPFVAIRSSGREEDLEDVARAGEFTTFLFVRGAGSFLHSVKLAWAGLWTERAIHNRAVLGVGAGGVGGGLIVQRIVRSRAAGVLQTENIGEGRLGEMVINVGLGMGEGIVSGSVGADQIVVAKGGHPEEGPLRFRYVTNDKREKVVFDARRGSGTVRVETLYHERFRPAMEYVEICELVGAAARLEGAYGCPLDIEFAIEGTRLAILQARPVVTFAAVLLETRDRYPMQ
jgi:hypothetical protein